MPANAALIGQEYKKSSESLLSAIASWDDKTLETEDDMYGERWNRATSLLILLMHQTHHRGQLTVLMRQAGLPIAGMYGPTKEDWAKYGMPTPPI